MKRSNHFEILANGNYATRRQKCPAVLASLPTVSTRSRFIATTRIFDARPEEKWILDSAAVDVSLICFGDSRHSAILNSVAINIINPDLTKAEALPENADGAFLGIQKSGPFDIPGTLARAWM